MRKCSNFLMSALTRSRSEQLRFFLFWQSLKSPRILKRITYVKGRIVYSLPTLKKNPTKTHSEFVFIKMKSDVSESKKRNQLAEIYSKLGKKKLFWFSLLIGIFGFLNLCKKKKFYKILESLIIIKRQGNNSFVLLNVYICWMKNILQH